MPFLVEWPSLLAHLNPLELWRRARTDRGTGGMALSHSAAALEAEFFVSLAPPEDGGQNPAA